MRGQAFAFSAEFRDWVGYCASLSKHLDVRLQD